MAEGNKKSDTVKDKPTENLYTTGKQNIAKHQLSPVCHTNHGLSHRTVAADVNSRAGFNKFDKDNKRPDDRIPTDHADIIAACQAVYRRVGMVRNIIDLMTDFAAEGLELQHTVKTQEKFYREWAKRVNLQGRAHDFMKLLMRDANVIVRRKNAKISRPVFREMTKGDVKISVDLVDETRYNESPTKVKVDRNKIKKNEIPWKYTFLSPTLIEKIGGEVGKFFGADALGMRLPRKLATRIANPRTDAEKEYISQLPKEVVQAAKSGSTLIRLSMDKIYVDYYKKDDWEDWGTPFLYGVLEDVMLKEKMRLADMAALDGVINVIRLWKLGKSDQQILPTSAAVDKLIGILQNNVGGGVMDLVWDDMIDLQVEYPPTDKILGEKKYIGVNADIVRGLGIPDSLIGGQDLGTRNAQSAFVQLKTLVERLEYVRGRAIRWMEGELKLVAKAMGFKKIPAINFGIMSLRDEAAEKQLMIQLLDRGIISAEKASETFGTNYMIELERLKSEQDIRNGSPGLLEKAGPYYRPISVMEKQSELAIELERVKQNLSSGPSSQDGNGGGSNPIGDQPKNDGNNPSGRPPSTKDTNPRDTRTSKTLSVLHVVADNFMSKIDNLFDVAYLNQNNAKNIRSLTKGQKTELEGIKRSVMSTLRIGDTVDMDIIKDKIVNDKTSAKKMNNIFNQLLDDFTKSTNQLPTTRDRRILTNLAWIYLVS